MGACAAALLPANGWQVDAVTIYNGGGLNLQYVSLPVILQRGVHNGLGSGDLFLDLDPETDDHRRVRGDTASATLRKPDILWYNRERHTTCRHLALTERRQHPSTKR